MTRSHTVTPLLSVIVPVYNAAETIGDTIASVVAQSRGDAEIIVVDDGSEDPRALDGALARWRRHVQLVRQPNRGAGAARNAGIAQARGRWLAFLDADDTWLPGFLDRQLSLLEARPELDMVWSDGWIVGETPLVGRTYLASTGTTEAPSFSSLVRQTCTVLTSAVVIRRHIVQSAGGFDESIRRGQDFDLWLRVAHAGAVMTVRTEPLVQRRIHGRNLSGDEATQLRRAIAVLQGLAPKVYLARGELRLVDDRVRRLTAQLELTLAKDALRAGDIPGARAHLQGASESANWKIHVARLGLRFTPDLLCRVYRRSTVRSGTPANASPT